MADVSLVNVKTEFIIAEGEFVVPSEHQIDDGKPLFHRHDDTDGRHGDSPVTAFRCGKCETEFSTRRLLLRHRSRKMACAKRRKLATRGRKYSCSVCSAGFIRCEHLQRHQAKKHGIGAEVSKDLPHSCPECSECFSTNQNLGDHSRFKHSAPRLQCPTCDKSFVFHKRFGTHSGGCVGSEPPSTVCEFCGKKFKHAAYLQSHLSVVHGDGAKQWVCDVCGSLFTHKGSMYRHRKSCVQSADPRVRVHCQLCSKSFTSAERLSLHLQHTHAQHMYACNICQAKFSRKQSMNVHTKKCVSGMLKRRRVDPTLPIECPACGKPFKKREYMEHHRDVAHGDGSKRHACDKCGCSFAYKGSMYRHRKQCRQSSQRTPGYGAELTPPGRSALIPDSGAHSASLDPSGVDEFHYSPSDVSVEVVIDDGNMELQSTHGHGL